MEKPRIGGYGFLIALVIMLNAGMVWARSMTQRQPGRHMRR